LHLVDLDLDVALTWGGEVIGLDEDEFACNQVALGYPDLIVKQAIDAFEEVKHAMSHDQFPFDATSDRYTSSWFTRSQLG
jgi:protein associated with RNAse G/E